SATPEIYTHYLSSAASDGYKSQGALVAGQAAVCDRCDVEPGTTVVSRLPLWRGTGPATALVLRSCRERLP
ncbi:hypothetical protein ACE14D_14860, partial [Streptomyces sp. Act-28]